MTDDVWPVPNRTERRGEFPAHDDRPRPVLTAEQARQIARERLERWRRDHE